MAGLCSSRVMPGHDNVGSSALTTTFQTGSARDPVSLVGGCYEPKNLADYEQEATVSVADAERAIEEASRLVGTIAALV